jgi:thiol reductant ABC exporter CydC subunit
MTGVLLRTLGLARAQRSRLGLGLAAAVLATACSLALLATSAWLISRAAQHPSVVALTLAVVGVRAFAIGRATLRYLERLTTHDATLRVLTDIRVSAYDRLERLAPAGLRAFRSGDLLRRLVGDVDGMGDVFLKGLLPYVSVAVVGLVTAGLLAVVLPAAGCVALAGLLVVGIAAPRWSSALSRRAERTIVQERAALTEEVVSTVEGLADLVAYDATTERLAALDRADRRLVQGLSRSARWTGVGSATTVLAAGLMVWGSLLAGIPAVRGGQLPGVLLAVVVLLPLALAEAAGALPTAAQELERSTAGGRRVFAVLDAADPVQEPGRPREMPTAPYHLEVHGLRARWTAEAPLVVDGLDLLLAPGRRVALVGPSGSGKTTVTACLLRFLDPADGTITLNGVNTRDLAGDEVRRVVGLVTEDAHVFDSTIWENVRLARPDASRDDVRHALERARLLDWVDTLPEGLDTRVGAHGDRLSGGQRQRLALARAVLAGFPILVLDEPGEQLDVATADALTADLLAATRDVTTLLITHRLVGLEDMDEIVMLEGGHVVQRGTHTALLLVAGPYRDAWRRERAGEESACAP